MNMKVSSGGIDVVMTKHFLDLKDGDPGLQQVLCIGVTQPVRGSLFRQTGLSHTCFYGIGHIRLADRPVGTAALQEKLAIFIFRTTFDHIGGNSLECLWRDWQRDRGAGLTISYVHLCLTELNIIQGELANFLRAQSHSIRYMNHGIGS